jgi:hypothetical protein
VTGRISGPSATAAPRYARPFVAALLVALVVSASVAVNPWPFSNWELFSRLRSDRQTRWQEVAVDSGGHVHDYVVSSLPAAHQEVVGLADDHSQGWADEHNAICAQSLGAGPVSLGPRAQVVRIYYLTWRLGDRRGERAAPPRRTLELTCSSRGSA